MNIGQNEIWRAIDGYLNYEVSSHGRVRNNKTGRILKSQLQNTGYYSVSLSLNGKVKIFPVHRLVCIEFNNNENNYNIVDHIDRNKLNNCYENLRWVNQSLNEKNKGVYKTNKCGHAGVRCDRGYWRAAWTENGIQKSKYCNSMEDAIAYRKEMEQLHGYL